MARNGNTSYLYANGNGYKRSRSPSRVRANKYLIQNYFGHSKDVWSKAEKRTPELKKAFNKGQAKTIGVVSKKLYELILAGNITAIMFYLKTRAGWSERYNPELDCNIVEPEISITVKDPIEAAKIYQQIMTEVLKNEFNFINHHTRPIARRRPCTSINL